MYDPDIHHRRSIRLPGYDYSRPGSYFVTIVTRSRSCLFGEIVSGKMVLNQNGFIAKATWEELPDHYHSMQIDKFVVMPNHVHGIIIINPDTVGAGFKPAPTVRYPLSEMIRGYKTFSARRINLKNNSIGTKLWQRNYYEHIIRDDADYTRISNYIDDNPGNWATDRLSFPSVPTSS